MPTVVRRAAASFVAAIAFATVARAAAPIYGGPSYDETTGSGYESSFWPLPTHRYVGAGAAVGGATYRVGQTSLGSRPFRWDLAQGNPTPTLLGVPAPNTAGVSDARAQSANDAGTAVGYASTYVGTTSTGMRAVRWDAGGTAITQLGDLGLSVAGATDSQAFAINAGGHAVGFATRYVGGTSTGNRAVRWDANQTSAVELNPLNTTTGGVADTRAFGINAGGTAVGYATRYNVNTSIGIRPVRWDGTTPIELETLGFSSSATAYVINDAGTIVGQATKQVDGTARGSRAVRWAAGGTAVTELGNLGTAANGRTDAWAWAMNEAGDAVGYATKYVDGVSRGNRPVRWDAAGTAATELGTLGESATGAGFGGAMSINVHGIAVGDADKYVAGTNVGSRAVAWGLDGVAIDLNTLLAADSGWTLTHAYEISDANWITGVGTYDPDGAGPLSAYGRAFLIQLPEPTTLAALAGVGVAVLRRRRR